MAKINLTIKNKMHKIEGLTVQERLENKKRWFYNFILEYFCEIKFSLKINLKYIKMD